MPAGYRDIAAALREQIRTGRLTPGARLPGIRALGAEHEVTAQTAVQAIRHLAAEGWVIVEPGRVTRVADPLPSGDRAPTTLPALAAAVDDLRSRVEALERRDRKGRGPAGRG